MPNNSKKASGSGNRVNFADLSDEEKTAMRMCVELAKSLLVLQTSIDRAMSLQTIQPASCALVHTRSLVAHYCNCVCLLKRLLELHDGPVEI